MGKVVAGMSISVDGFIEDANGSAAALYSDFEALHDDPLMHESIAQTGAVIMGRHAFAMGGIEWWDEGYEFQVPIFVLTHQPPDPLPQTQAPLTFTFVTDGVESAVAQAKAAAGDKDVTVIGGASTIQQLLRAGLVDELDVDVMPVLLGGGLRLFDNLDGANVALEKMDVKEHGPRTHLRFCVVK